MAQSDVVKIPFLGDSDPAPSGPYKKTNSMCDEEKKCACWVPECLDCPQELTCEDFDSGCKEAFDGLGWELDIGI